MRRRERVLRLDVRSFGRGLILDAVLCMLLAADLSSCVLEHSLKASIDVRGR